VLSFQVLSSPLTPLQPELLRTIQRILWLERGVKERGGFAPSQILSPSQTMIKSIILQKPV
jgi:hypothetical protein